MKTLYKIILALTLILWISFTSVYMHMSIDNWFTMKYYKYTVELASGDNNKQNTLLASELYSDFSTSDSTLLYKYNSSNTEMMNTTILTNNEQELNSNLVDNESIVIGEFEDLQSIKGDCLTIYSNVKLKQGNSKYILKTLPKDQISIFLNNYIGIWGMLLFFVLISLITISTLLYLEYNKERIRTLYIDGNSLHYTYKVLILNELWYVLIGTAVASLIVITLLNSMYTTIVFYFLLLSLIIFLISYFTIRYLFYNVNTKISISKLILYAFEIVHVVVLILLINFIGSTIELYNHVEPNQEFARISSKFEGYDTFKQSTTGGETLDYEVAAPLYTDYYNFLNQNFDVVVAKLNNMTDIFNQKNAINNYILVNQNYFNIFDVYTDDNKVISDTDFDDDTFYFYKVKSVEFNQEFENPNELPYVETRYLKEGQPLWYIDGSMEVSGANTINDVSLAVIPDNLSPSAINDSKTYNWINSLMSSSSVLVKGGKDSEINQQYLKNNELDTTFRKWSSVTENYQDLIDYVNRRLNIYLKLIIIIAIITVFIAIIDLYFYFYTYRKKASILLLDGNGYLYIIKPYIYNLLLKLVIIGYYGYLVLHLSSSTIAASVVLIFMLSVIIIFTINRFITLRIHQFIKGER